MQRLIRSVSKSPRACTYQHSDFLILECQHRASPLDTRHDTYWYRRDAPSPIVTHTLTVLPARRRVGPQRLPHFGPHSVQLGVRVRVINGGRTYCMLALLRRCLGGASRRPDTVRTATADAGHMLLVHQDESWRRPREDEHVAPKPVARLVPESSQ